MSVSVFVRRALVLGVMTLTGVFGMASADAQEVRYFVKQSSGLFEITGQATGGKFVVSPTGESIRVNGVALPVRGRTDRASRGETLVNQIRGSGLAQVKVTYTPNGHGLATIFNGTIPLPFVLPREVAPDASVDNLTVTVIQGGKSVQRRLPIGTR